MFSGARSRSGNTRRFFGIAYGAIRRGVAIKVAATVKKMITRTSKNCGTKDFFSETGALIFDMSGTFREIDPVELDNEMVVPRRRITIHLFNLKFTQKVKRRHRVFSKKTETYHTAPLETSKREGPVKSLPPFPIKPLMPSEEKSSGNFSKGYYRRPSLP